MLAHHGSEAGPPPQPSDEPRPQSPCRGLHCSKGIPVVPAPLPVKVQMEDQHCWFSQPAIAARSTDFERPTCNHGFRLPELHTGRLDRPPRAV